MSRLYFFFKHVSTFKVVAHYSQLFIIFNGNFLSLCSFLLILSITPFRLSELTNWYMVSQSRMKTGGSPTAHCTFTVFPRLS
mmetsp:Transcript_25870/g.59076  ORF Transcript_25870/g.59076 Transcript_25870/m.59076 type:complete len:82 (+) Transcript_25870:53-298(+)